MSSHFVFIYKPDKPNNISCIPGRTLPAGNGLCADRTDYLSPAPQAEPQAVGFSSGLSAAPQAAGVSAGLSPAPQAEPQAVGFSSSLSPAPQAVPHEAAGAASTFLFHPQRFESARVLTSIHVFRLLFCSLYLSLYGFFSVLQVRTFL